MKHRGEIRRGSNTTGEDVVVAWSELLALGKLMVCVELVAWVS